MWYHIGRTECCTYVSRPHDISKRKELLKMMNTNETLGARIARLRKEKKMTQDEVAEKLNVSPQAVSKWENDDSHI